MVMFIFMLVTVFLKGKKKYVLRKK